MKPARMKIHAENIPPDLLRDENWIVWRWKKRKGKWTKPLYNPKTGQYAKSNDPSTWATFTEAWRTYEAKNYDGIGYVLTKGDGYTGIDYDKVRDPETGKVDPEALERIRAINSYTEISPSQQGLKTIVRAKLPDRDRQSEHYSFYSERRYFCITGHIYNGISPSIEKRQEEVDRLYSELFPEKEKVSQEWETQPSNDIDDSKIIEKALSAKDNDKFKQLWEGDWSGYPSQSEADQALCNKLAFWVGANLNRIDALFRQSGLMRNKWERQDYRERTIGNAITQATETYQPSNVVDINRKQTENLAFPSYVIAGLAGDFAKLYSSYLEVPAHFFYMVFLTCLGLVLSNSLTLASEIAPQPRLFVLLLGESADDRKSTALNKVVDFFKWVMEDFSVCWGVGSAEGLQKRLEDNNRLLLCFDEFKQFISKCKIEASVLLPCVNTLFESNRYESRTKRTDIYLEDVYLTLMAASTLDTYDWLKYAHKGA